MQQGFDGDALLGEDAADVGHHAGFVLRRYAQVVAAGDFVDRQRRQLFIAAESQRRHALLAGGVHQAGGVDDVGHHGAGSGGGTGAGAVIQGFAHHIGLHQHGVHHALHLRQQAAFRHERGVYAQFDTLVGFTGDAQQFDAVAQLFGIADVLAFQLADAFQVAVLEVNRRAEGEGGHDAQLVRRIVAFDVESRVGFGIAQLLRLLEHFGKRAAVLAHIAQDEVAGAVDDADHRFDAVGGQTFAQGFDNRNAAGHRRFKHHHHIFFRRPRENFVAVFGQEFFVGGDHVFAVFDGAQHHFACRIRAADQLHHDIHIRAAGYLKHIVRHHRVARAQFADAVGVVAGSHADAHLAPQAARDFLRVFRQ